MARNILILGASYGSLLATKLLMAGHNVTLVCRKKTAELINRDGTEVRIKLRDEPNHRAIFSRDLPGKLDDDGLIPIFKAADLVVCPFAYDEFSYESTILFSVVLRQINKSSVIYYVPNRVKANVRYETQMDVNAQLLKIGKLAPPVPDRIDFQRTNTFMTPLAVLPLVLTAFEPLYEEIKKTLPSPTS